MHKGNFAPSGVKEVMQKMSWIKKVPLLLLCSLLAGCERQGGIVFEETAGGQPREEVLWTESITGVTGKAGTEEAVKKAREEIRNETVRSTEAESIYVHVCGAVKHPGVYELKSGDRVYEAVKKAGGFEEGAAEEAVNQAAVLADGQRLYIWDKEEAMTLEAGAENAAAGQAALQQSAAEPGESKVDLNKATKEQLMELPGIGESKAEDIMAYREENGGFRSTEEIMNIKGIKEAVYSKIKDKIVVQ